MLDLSSQAERSWTGRGHPVAGPMWTYGATGWSRSAKWAIRRGSRSMPARW